MGIVMQFYKPVLETGFLCKIDLSIYSRSDEMGPAVNRHVSRATVTRYLSPETTHFIFSAAAVKNYEVTILSRGNRYLIQIEIICYDDTFILIYFLL